ncbi:MAG TPA: hypothetical protein VIL85_14160 [Thermomicrobiales bacterium]|jgi:hypothetical protein
MRLFDGLDRTDYQDLLRALGRECDHAALHDLRIIETDSGLRLQFRYVADLAAGFQNFTYDDSALLTLLQESYTLRGRGTEDLAIHSSLGMHYQQLLRSVGRVLDQEGLRDLRFIEQRDRILIQTSTGLLRRGYRSYHLSVIQLHDLISATLSGTPASFGPALR